MRSDATSGSSGSARSGCARRDYTAGVDALLELALVNMAVAQAVAAGFTPMITPVLVKHEAMEGTGFLGAHWSSPSGDRRGGGRSRAERRPQVRLRGVDPARVSADGVARRCGAVDDPFLSDNSC